MKEIIENAQMALHSLSDQMLSMRKPQVIMFEQWGWSTPAVSLEECAGYLSDIEIKIGKLDPKTISTRTLDFLSAIPRRTELFQTQTLSYMINPSHALQAMSVFMTFVDWLERGILREFEWDHLKDTKSMPKSLLNRLQSIQVNIDEIEPDIEGLRKKIKEIDNAHEAAESLPVDMLKLKDAKTNLDRITRESSSIFVKLEDLLSNCTAAANEIKEREREAIKLIEQCEAAYNVTTTKGLAGSFQQRADKLANSMYWMILILVFSLVGAIFIGHDRFTTINDALKDKDVSIGVVWIQIALSILGLGAPVWLAWILTKQIGNRFKLSEDYAFKASVAKAYEGYRKEAVRIDPEMEARLFGSALTRLEEAPLRLVDKEEYSTPWQEWLNSPTVRSWMNLPEFRDKVIDMAASIVNKKTTDNTEN